MTRPLAIATIAFFALALSCHGAEPAAIPYKQAPAVDELMMRLVGGLVLVAVVGLGIALLIRRFLPGLRIIPGQTAALQVMQRTRVSATNQLVVVRYGDEELLLAEGPQGVQLLKSRPYAPEQKDGSHA
ncbi:flagellar biosynthetic protein FliO [Chitinimonas sp. JJ19]|uniref:flagellar biosynthetic protein FliO n=1 Tax=Chitinimonas sp. JJ19 TaxID=3109352 RepID=UPI003001767B